jgi:glycosyltransferase involved in cell wall biosynthesis
MVRLASVTAAVSEEDASYYRSICAEPQRVMVLSNAIDIADYPRDLDSDVRIEPLSVCLAGTFGHHGSPMDTAASWLVDQVWPLVTAAFPEAHLYLVGLNSDRMWNHIASEHIHVTGRVVSTAPYLSGCGAVVVPLKFESGTRFKILEGGAFGKPIVSTTLGAEGLEMEHGHNILIADTASDFAASIVSIFGGTAPPELGQRCREVIELKYGLPALRLQVEAILASLSPADL